MVMPPAVPMMLVTREIIASLPVCEHCDERMIWLCGVCNQEFRVGDFYCLIPMDDTGVNGTICLDCASPW